MAKLEEYKEVLKEYEGKELKTNYFINNLGITSYYIGQLYHQGVITKLSKGLYKVNDLTKGSSNGEFKGEDKIDALTDCKEETNGSKVLNDTPKNEGQELRIRTKKDKGKSAIHFSHFLEALQQLDFNTAYDEIKLSLDYFEEGNNFVYLRNYNIYLLLDFLKEIQKDKIVIEEANNVYLIDESDNFNLNRAIKLKDWKAAKQFLSKMEIGSSLTLEAYDLILKAIFRQDKINRGIALTEEDELTPLSCHLKEVNNYKRPPIVRRQELVVDETDASNDFEDMSQEEVLDSIKNLQLNYQTLYQLIKNREFEEAYALISREEANGYSIEQIVEEKEDVPKLQGTTQTEVVEEVLETVEESLITDPLEEVEATDTGELISNVEPLSEEEKHKLEVLESIKDLGLTYDNLYDLICDRRYEEARYLIEREENNYSSRLTVNVHRLITQLQQINNHIIKDVEQEPIDYSLDNFKIFYAALKNRDYNLALEYVDLCIDITNNKKELVLLKLILQDIVPVYNQEIEEKQQKKKEARQREEELGRLYDINNELKELSYKYEFDSEDVKNILSLLEEKIEISKRYDKGHVKDIMVLGVAEAALMASNKALNIDCFARIATNDLDKYSDDTYSANFSTDKTKIGDIFYKALEYGDLITVYDIITTESWDNLRENISPVNLRLIKFLLEFVNERTPLHEISEEDLDRKKERARTEKASDEKQKQIDDTIYELLNDEEKGIYRHIAFLDSLDSAVENNQFTDALNELLATDVPFNDTEVISNILLAHNSIKEEVQVLFDQFLKAEKLHNVEDALDALNSYRDYVKEFFANYDINYLYKRINTLKKDLATRNYREKERVFENARSLFNKGQFEKSLGIINKYIAMDRYINNKGFVLKGDIYCQMGNCEQAKEAYLKALTVAPDPMVCLNLGNMYFNEENYEKASYYLELYVQMNPFRETNISRMLTSCYESLGKKEKVKKHII